ncbi:MAG: ABC transporter substrate-binding protein [Candidatus Methanofastidiosa archaeon]|jgi:iron complex transport system substrate-binding protein|nr:ABC transporter substrate-binding protein [Candidatus Methanofastidiosa archaeon]
MKMKNRKIEMLILLAILTVAVCAAGCTSQGTESSTSKTRTVVDLDGRAVEIPEDVNRIVGTFPWIAWTIYAFNAEDKLIGTDSKSPNFLQFDRLDPEYKKLPSVGFESELNSEEIMKLDPEVVFCTTNSYEQLAKLGIPAIVLDPTNDWMNSVRVIGKVLKKEDRAEEIISYYNEITELTSSRTSDIPENEKQKIYFAHMQKYTTMGGANSYAPNSKSYTSRHVNFAGGINVAEKLIGWNTKVDKEQLLAWDPDVIILVYGPLKEKTMSVEDFLSDPDLQGIKAVKNKRVYDEGAYYIYWYHPTVGSCLGILQMAKVMYPERFEDVNVTKKAKEFDMKFFGRPYGGNAGGVDELN